MGKLSNVKTIDMVNGEVTKIEHNGSTYVKTDDKVKVGDIFRLMPGHLVIEGEDYAYYSTQAGSGSTVLVDTKYLGSASAVQSYGEGVAFRKTSEASASVGDRVTALESRVSNLEAKKPVQLETITHEGVDYKRVDREAREGDVVVVRETGDCDLTVGKAYVVTGKMSGTDARIIDDVGDNNIVGSDSEEFDVYEPIVAKPAPLQVGDYAKVVAHNNDNCFGGAVGDIVKVTCTKGERYSVEELDGGDYRGNPFAKKEALVRATDEEVAEAKRQQAEKAVADKWADIGREAAEFKKGDIVRVVAGSVYSAGTIGEVTELRNSGGLVRVEADGRLYGNWHDSDDVELITPVEQRFDKFGGDSE